MTMKVLLLAQETTEKKEHKLKSSSQTVHEQHKPGSPLKAKTGVGRISAILASNFTSHFIKLTCKVIEEVLLTRSVGNRTGPSREDQDQSLWISEYPLCGVLCKSCRHVFSRIKVKRQPIATPTSLFSEKKLPKRKECNKNTLLQTYPTQQNSDLFVRNGGTRNLSLHCTEKNQDKNPK